MLNSAGQGPQFGRKSVDFFRKQVRKARISSDRLPLLNPASQEPRMASWQSKGSKYNLVVHFWTVRGSKITIFWSSTGPKQFLWASKKPLCSSKLLSKTHLMPTVCEIAGGGGKAWAINGKRHEFGTIFRFTQNCCFSLFFNDPDLLEAIFLLKSTVHPRNFEK